VIFYCVYILGNHLSGHMKNCVMLPSQLFLVVVLLAALSSTGEECSCDVSSTSRVDANHGRRLDQDIRVQPANIKGDAYRRPQASPLSRRKKSSEDVSGCESSQISVFLGDDYTSMVVSFASPTQGTGSIVQYSTHSDYVVKNSKHALTAYGQSRSYSELLFINHILVDPNMDAAPVTEEYIIDKQDTTRWAYDKKTGEHYANWKNVTAMITGLGRYNNPYMIYDSPLIHRVYLTDLTPATTYYYRVQGSCKVYSFFLPPLPSSFASSKEAFYPLKMGLVGDIGQTQVSEKSASVLASMLPHAVLLVGDLSYADGYMPLWDSFGEMMEPLAATVCCYSSCLLTNYVNTMHFSNI
jgi:hypothetical protein